MDVSAGSAYSPNGRHDGTVVGPRDDETDRRIAIIGIGCRLPGSATDPDAFWELLLDKRSAAGRVPADRFNVDKYLHPDKARPGSIRAGGGYFLNGDPTLFEPNLFNIHPNEAAKLDPALRKLIEVVFESIESAGIPLERLAGSDTGCYVGSFNHDELFSKARDSLYADAYTSTSAIAPFLSNRLSYIFDLHGPSMTVDTACSASFYALHLACQAISNRELESAIVASSNLVWSPDMQIFLDKLGALSPSSQCNVFDESADGYGRADGFVSFFLKDLAAAQRDGDPIHAVLRATAVNSNGRTGGITHPSATAQESVMRKAYQSRPDLNPADTAYYECHGTGTAVGDPIEIKAIQSFFSSSRSVRNPLLLGSVKSNIGHGEPVSGLAGLLKATMAIKRGMIPPMLMPKRINRRLGLDSTKFQLVSDSTKWPEHLPRRASVASSGFGGANAHVIVEGHFPFQNGRPESPTSTQIQHHDGESRLLMIFSAHKPDSLVANYNAVAAVSSLHAGLDLAYTLSHRRSRFLYRGFAIAAQTEGRCSLEKNGMKVAADVRTKAPKIGLVFTGQGAQWPQMANGLFERFSTFRESIEKMSAALQRLPDKPTWSLSGDILNEPAKTSRMYEAEISQPACTALQVGLVSLIRSWNVCPSAVVGHSSGEMAAAYAAGSITAEEAIITAYYRGKAMTKLTKRGCMLAVGCGAQQIEPYLSGYKNDLRVAAVNSPESLTISGDSEAIYDLKNALSKDNIFNRVLETGEKAYHSHHMLEVGEFFEKCMNSSERTETNGILRSYPITFSSSVFGHRCENFKPTSSYWRRNLESPVLFEAAFEDLVERDIDIVIEIGPHSALAGPIFQIETTYRNNSRRFPTYLPSLVRKRQPVLCMLELAGSLYNWDTDVDILEVNRMGDPAGSMARRPRVITDLPTYRYVYQPSEHQFNRLDREFRFPLFQFDELIGSLIPGCSLSAPSWRNIVRKTDLPHTTAVRVNGVPMLPESCLVAMVLQACKQVVNFNRDTASLVNITSFALDQVCFLAPLEIDEEQDVVLSMLGDGDDSQSFSFVITSVRRDRNIRHCCGKVRISMKDTYENTCRHSRRTPEFSITTSGSKWYQKLADGGIEFSEFWKKISSVGSTPNLGVIGCVRDNLTDSEDVMALIEPALQMAAFSTAHQGQPRNLKPGRLLSIGKIYLDCVSARSGVGQVIAARISETDIHGQVTVVATVCNAAGEPVLSLDRAIYYSPLENGRKPDHMEKFCEVVSKADISQDSPDVFSRMFPPPVLPDTEIFRKVHTLAAAMVIQFRRSTPGKQDMTFGSAGESFLEWLERATIRAQDSSLPDGRRIFDLSSADTASLIDAMYAEISGESVEAQLMMRMYRNLYGVIDGTVSAHDLLLSDGLLGNLYTSKFTAMGSMCQLRRIVDLLGHKNPSAKYIEIGGGTRGATREILSVLGPDTGPQRYGQYHFTDVSSYFLGGAQSEFARHADVTYGILDIENPPIDQGLEEASFDVVIASNVLHATSSVEQTLRHVRSLLKDGGQLVLVETTIETAWLTLVLGGFQDYWKGRQDGRSSSPFLPVSEWSRLLQLTGFATPHIDLPDYDGTDRTMNVLVATSTSITSGGKDTESLHRANGWIKGHTNGFHHACPPLREIERLYPISEANLDGMKAAALELSDGESRDPGKTVVLVDFVADNHLDEVLAWLAASGVTSIIAAETDHEALRKGHLQALEAIGKIQRLGVTIHLLPDPIGQISCEDLLEIFSYLTTGIGSIVFGPISKQSRRHATAIASRAAIRQICDGPSRPDRVIMFAEAQVCVKGETGTADLGFVERRSVADAWAEAGTCTWILGTWGPETQFDDLVPLLDQFLMPSGAQGLVKTQGRASIVLAVSASDLAADLSESAATSRPHLSVLAQSLQSQKKRQRQETDVNPTTPLAAAKSRFELLDHDVDDELRCTAGAEVVAHILAELLFLPREQIGLEDDITRTGIDSLVATEFRLRLQRYFGQSVALDGLLSGGVSLRDVMNDILRMRQE